jgi:hypothetical protein
MTADRSILRARSIAGATLAVIFATGVLTGLLLAPLLRPRGAPPLPPGYESLGLTAGQHAQALAVIDSHGPEVERALSDVQPRLRVIHDQVERELRALLTDEQRARLDRMPRRGAGRPPLPR